MSLIDNTYFNYEINLPASNYSDIQGFIDRLEPEILQKALGYPLAKLVGSYVALTATDPIKSLVEGDEFTDLSGKVRKWNGLINTGKKSLIAYYVYYYYRRDKVTYTTPMGEKKGTAENSADAEIGNKIMRAWNLMTDELDMMDAYIQTIPELYAAYDPECIGSVNSFDL